jgi:hypothetical protein
VARIDWWHETREKLETIGKLCTERNKAAVFHKGGKVTIYPDQKELESLEEALEYMGA